MPDGLAARSARTAGREMTKPALIAAALLASGCAATMPSGPSILVLPGTGKNFDQFRADEMDCRGYAHGQVGGKTTEQAAQDQAVKSAVVGTAIGTVAGAALGGHQGAAVGAGVGLAGGSIVGAESSYAAAGSIQRRYDNAFTQCMYAKGHRVPVTGRYSDSRPTTASSSSGARTPPPPPPPGQPPAEAPPDYRPK
jgi:Glycine-zipper domain